MSVVASPPAAVAEAKVAAVIKGLDNPFFQSMQQGIEGQAKTAGISIAVEAAKSITDTTGQAQKLTALAGQDYGCYIVNPISGIVANDDMGLGVAAAIAAAGKTGTVKVISVDGNKEALVAVKAGGVDAVVAQYPYAIGSMAVEACQAAAAGKTLPADVKAPVQLVTRANADQAIASTPKPFQTYDDPFRELLK